MRLWLHPWLPTSCPDSWMRLTSCGNARATSARTKNVARTPRAASTPSTYSICGTTCCEHAGTVPVNRRVTSWCQSSTSNVSALPGPEQRCGSSGIGRTLPLRLVDTTEDIEPVGDDQQKPEMAQIQRLV